MTQNLVFTGSPVQKRLSVPVGWTRTRSRSEEERLRRLCQRVRSLVRETDTRHEGKGGRSR